MPAGEISRKSQVINYKIGFLTVALFLLSLITYNFSLVASQSSLDEAKKTYLTQLTQFNKSKEAYITAKANYKSFQTATAKNEAFTKTKEYLIDVDNLLIAYLSLVTQYGNNTRWQTESFDKAITDQTITTEVNFVKDHIDRVQNTKTLEELPALAKELKNQLENSANPKINKIITTYDIAQTESIFSQFAQTSEDLTIFVEKRARADQSTLLSNWKSEIAQIKESTQAKLNQAKESYTKISDVKDNQFQVRNTNNLTQGAKDELKRSKDLFSEMLRII